MMHAWRKYWPFNANAMQQRMQAPIPMPRMFQPDEKTQWNFLLGEWLIALSDTRLQCTEARVYAMHGRRLPMIYHFEKTGISTSDTNHGLSYSQ
jgi:hypothetical protein